MSWITYSSRSSKHGERRYESDKRTRKRNAGGWRSYLLSKTKSRSWGSASRVVGALSLLLPLALFGFQPAQAFPNVGVNLKQAIEKQRAANREMQKPGFRMGILGSFEFQTDEHKYEASWHGVLDRIKAETAVYTKCGADGAGCNDGVLQWRQKLESLKGLPVPVQLASLNKFVNRMASYADDSRTFGKKDHWASPLEFFKGKADCEDYAAVKFWSLLELGYSNDQLRLAVVRDTRRRILHAVVTVDTEDGTIVLDSLFDHPVEQRHVLKYKPVYSANLDKQWLHIVTRQIRTVYLNRVEQGDWKRPIPVRVSTEPAVVTLAKARSNATPPANSPVVDWT